MITMPLAMWHLQKQLGYIFKNPALLQQALTHRSASSVHNERLEFLGDAVLGFVIASVLYKRFKGVTEGELSQMRSTLVCRKTLAELAKQFCLFDVMILGPGVLKSGSFRPDSITADALEAIIGAIYLDSQHSDAIEKLIIDWYKSRLDTIEPGNKQKDPKTQLQEYVQRVYQQKPSYVIIAVQGDDHNKKFIVQCKIPLEQAVYLGEGTSKRRAEQAAARQAMHDLKIV